jgi:hypothetical protein
MFFEQASELMSLDLDGALPDDQEERLQTYLDESSREAQLLERMRASALLFERPPLLAPPPMLAARTMQRIQQRERWRVWMRRLGVSTLILVIAVSLLCVALGTLSTMAINNPSLAHAAVRLLVRFAETACALVAALGMVARSALGSANALWLVAWVMAAVLLLFAWIRVVARPRLTPLA